jgi:cytochrome b
MTDGSGSRARGADRSTQLKGRVRIWDLPTRLFHWTLAALILFSLVSVKLGSAWLEWHMRAGYAILALLLFRILWGFAGSRYALFATFVRGPSIVIGYLRGRVRHAGGHNPLGGLSVLAMLAVLLVQASTGLFSNDGNFTEGPLAKLLDAETVDLVSSIHRYGEWVVYGLVGLHVVAVVYYTAFRFEPLVAAMVNGDRRDLAAPPAQDDGATRLRALVLAALCALLVTYIVTL